MSDSFLNININDVMDIGSYGTRNSLEALLFKPIALLLLNKNLNNRNKILEIKPNQLIVS